MATPHLDASELKRGRAPRLAAFERAWRELMEARDAARADLWLDLGTELRLDDAGVDYTDAQLRLGSSRAVLVEFVSLEVPPFGARQLREVSKAGFVPVLAHPERYRGVNRKPEVAESWREAGAVFQVNAGSLTGQYGKAACEAAHWLVARGWSDLLASDYPARGPTRWEEAWERWGEGAGHGTLKHEAWNLLVSENPARILRELPLRPVPPVNLELGLWEKIRSQWK